MYIQKYKYLFLYMQSENMYRTCLYHVYTWIYQPKQVHTCYKQPKARYLHVLHAIKKSIIAGLKPSTLCIPASCLNHYATSFHAGMQYLQYMYAFYQDSDAGVALLVLNPPPPQPGHDVTCQFIKTDSLKARPARVASLATPTEGHRDRAW